MPLTTPPSASAPLYARNKVTGETYFVGSPATSEVEVTATDPLTTNANAELWYAPAGQAPVVPLWDIATAYAAGDLVLWPDPDHWQASQATVAGEEPGVAAVWVSVPAPTAPAGVLSANVGGVWEAVTSAEVSEVEVDAVEPAGDWELWVDTSAQSPPKPGTYVIALDELTDVDTTTALPADGNALVWDATTGQWIPGSISGTIPAAGTTGQALTKVDDTDGATEWSGPHLELAGGAVTGPTTFAGQVDLNGPVNAATPITWPATTADKLILYPTAGSRFGLGIESGTLSLFVDQAANKVAFKIGGTERAFIDQNGLGPRSTINVSYLNGFTGSTSFRVNPAMVTLSMMNVVNANDIYGFGELQVCALPAGVPAPFTTVSASGATYIGSATTVFFRVEVRSGGVYIVTLADNILAGDLTCSVSLTYSR